MPDSPLVPQEDATLLFTNAGMVQFKDNFTRRPAPGLAARRLPREGDAGFEEARTTTSETWGRARATTPSSEMLGNFSFGDYFKE